MGKRIKSPESERIYTPIVQAGLYILQEFIFGRVKKQSILVCREENLTNFVIES